MQLGTQEDSKGGSYSPFAKASIKINLQSMLGLDMGVSINNIGTLT